MPLFLTAFPRWNMQHALATNGGGAEITVEEMLSGWGSKWLSNLPLVLLKTVLHIWFGHKENYLWVCRAWRSPLSNHTKESFPDKRKSSLTLYFQTLLQWSFKEGESSRFWVVFSLNVLSLNVLSFYLHLLTKFVFFKFTLVSVWSVTH